MHTLSVGIYAYFISRHAARAFGLVQVNRQRQRQTETEADRDRGRQRQRQTETEADRDRGRQRQRQTETEADLVAQDSEGHKSQQDRGRIHHARTCLRCQRMYAYIPD